MPTVTLLPRQLDDAQLNVIWEIRDHDAVWLTVPGHPPMHMMGAGDGTSEKSPLLFNIKRFREGLDIGKRLADLRGEPVYFTSAGSTHLVVEYPTRR